MANVLLTWELGGGLGHLVTLLPLARGLVERGHRVTVALSNLSRAEKVFAGVGVAYLQAPLSSRKSRHGLPRTFPQILCNNGFGDPGELRATTGAWRGLYDYTQPDLIVFDHSPTALLAARGIAARKALIGTGFCAPVVEHPMRDLRPWLGDASGQLRRDEDQVLKRANEALAQWGQPPLEYLSQMYDVDENFLLTFKELDHYANRQGAEYWGAWPEVGGKEPVWPEGDGKRVYAYLKPFDALPRLLALLCELQCPTIVYSGGISDEVQKRYASQTLLFENEPLDLKKVGRQCDLAILNATHYTTISMLLAGKPTLQLPLYLEQIITSMTIRDLGVGLNASAKNPEQITLRLLSLLRSDRHAEAARQFAAKYADFSPAGQIEKMLTRAEELLAS